MQSGTVLELIKILPNYLAIVVAVIMGWFLFRRLEQIKSEVARHSDFNQKWADLFFEASNAFMVSVEHILTYFVFLANNTDKNVKRKKDWLQEIYKSDYVLLENYYRIKRLTTLARSKGSVAEKAADCLFENVQTILRNKGGNVDELRGKIDAFNQAVREAHAEMIASRRSS